MTLIKDNRASRLRISQQRLMEMNVPLFVPQYCSVDELNKIYEYFKIDYKSEPGQRFTYSINNDELDKLPLPWKTGKYKNASSLINDYKKNHDLEFHTDHGGTLNMITSIIGVRGAGVLKFVRPKDKTRRHNGKYYSVDERQKKFWEYMTFFIRPGDAVFWSATVEENGWQ